MPARPALLLDLDGTLLELAATPADVVVPPGLVALLHRLRAGLGEALAIVTGRPIEQIDALLGDAPYAVAGEHGGAIRAAPGAAVVRPALPPPPPDWLDRAATVVAAHPGTRLEPKPRGFAVHYRQAPEAGPAIAEAMRALVAGHEDRFALLAAHMAWEVRPHGADKGTAVASLMAVAPFAGRLPVYAGDDVTDEDAIRMARDLGGVGLRVQDVFGTPAGVRAWLAEVAATL